MDFQNGSFDSAHETLMHYSTMADQESWVIPFDGPGGADDVRGAVLIDADTGLIDQTFWLNPGDPSWSLGQLNEFYTDQFTDVLPMDDVVPEPASVGLAVLGAAMIGLRRNRSRSRARA